MRPLPRLLRYAPKAREGTLKLHFYIESIRVIKVTMTYLNYSPEIQAMIYTTNWIERLNRDFRRVTRMRTAMPNEESVLTLMGSVAMDHKAFDRALPNMTIEKKLFPD